MSKINVRYIVSRESDGSFPVKIEIFRSYRSTFLLKIYKLNNRRRVY
jgi:hypothetical protein